MARHRRIGRGVTIPDRRHRGNDRAEGRSPRPRRPGMTMSIELLLICDAQSSATPTDSGVISRTNPKTHQRPKKVAGVGPVVRLDEPEVVPDVAQVASEDASLMRRFVRMRTIRPASLLRVASGEHCCLRSRPELRRVSAAFRSRRRPKTSPGPVSFGLPKKSESRPRDAFRRSCDLDRGHVGSVSKETLPVPSQ